MRFGKFPCITYHHKKAQRNPYARKEPSKEGIVGKVPVQPCHDPVPKEQRPKKLIKHYVHYTKIPLDKRIESLHYFIPYPRKQNLLLLTCTSNLHIGIAIFTVLFTMRVKRVTDQ